MTVVHTQTEEVKLLPPPEARYPPNDEWTEPDYRVWGEWASGTGAGVIELDPSMKVIRDNAIKYTVTYPDYYGMCIFTLNDGLEVNCDLYPRFKFLIGLESSFNGIVTIVLEDAAGMRVLRDEFVPPGEWPHLLTLLVGSVNAALWTVDPFNTQPFDWTKVKKIIWNPWFDTPREGSFWLDGIYFTYSIAGLRALDVTVVVKDTEPPMLVAGAKVVYGHLVGVDPETGEETYFWMEGEAKVTGDDGRVVFSELEPDWYGLKVSADGFKESLVKDIDLTAADKAITVELEPVSILDWLLPALVLGGFAVGAVIIIEKL